MEEIIMKTFEGKLVSEGIKVGIVAARFNDFIVSKLVGAVRTPCCATVCGPRISAWPGFPAPLRYP